MTERIGQRLGNYRLISRIGKGGFAEVYLGEHIYLKTEAAIKVLSTHLAPIDLEDFLREARTIARLRHPHIVQVWEFGMEDGIPFLVMDYAPHGTLRKRHPKGVPVPLATALPYTVQVAAALQYAHDAQVIHRDIKPGNMLVGRHNEILLGDFGTALAMVDQDVAPLHSLEMAGTMAYIAPEQLQGRPNFASDQYALAMVAYEWLSGDRPFRGSVREVADMHLSIPPPPLREKVPDIPPAVEDVIHTALAKDANKRFASVQLFAQALEVACAEAQLFVLTVAHPTLAVLSAVQVQLASAPPELSTSAVVVLPVTPLPTSDEQPRQSNSTVSEPLTPLPVALPMTPLPLFDEQSESSGGSGSSESESIASESLAPAPLAPLAPMPVSNQPQSAKKRYLSRRTVVVGFASVALAAGGLSWLVSSQRHPSVLQSTHPLVHPPTAVPTFSPPAQRPAVVHPSSSTRYTYHHTAEVFAVAWSPDGTRIASGSKDQTVQVWDATTGHLFYTYTGHADSIWTVAWSPNGKHLAAAGHDGKVLVWDAATGEHIFTYTNHTDAVRSVAWSPDSTRIVSASYDGSAQVWEASTGRLLSYRRYGTNEQSATWSPDGKRIASASWDGTVQVWSATSSYRYFVAYGHTNIIQEIAWSPNGQYLASCAQDQTVRVWNASDGTPASIYTGHKEAVNAVTWSPDSKRIASGGNEGTVRVWDTLTGKHVFVYTGHHQAVNAVAWMPHKGTLIASGSMDHSVQVWLAK